MEKGIDLDPRSPKKIKYEGLLKKRDNERNSLALLEGLFKIKKDRFSQ
jgi:hypothetical protein